MAGSWRLGLVVVVGVSLVAGVFAGSSGAATAVPGPSDPVAVIGSVAITKGAFDHWVSIANDAGQVSSGKAAPAVPVPPDFTACIATLRSEPNRAGDNDETLKELCSAGYNTLVSEVMEYLIQSIWIQGEANGAGVSVTQAQVGASYAAQRRASAPPLDTTAELNAFLAKSGQTRLDLKWRTRLNLLTAAIQHQAASKAAPVTAAEVSAYYAAHRSDFPGKSLEAVASGIRKLLLASHTAAAIRAQQKNFAAVWLKRTTCLTGFSVANSCAKTADTIATDPSASYPGTIVSPPEQPQPRVFTPSNAPRRR
jgi:hypothetical protein